MVSTIVMDVTTRSIIDADQIQYPSTQLNRVLVIGLGQLGLPVAKYIKQRGGFDVYGYDISSKAMDRAQTTAGIKKATNFSDFDVYILCISTHKPED
ncbi:MAG TPA: NAD(P)-binding domain-containing protein, partial [Nitrososphaeraceae archaeon]|nr:NAD(P)-binding domain-containing protein [Nitrososphaeraceae archaeon]